MTDDLTTQLRYQAGAHMGQFRPLMEGAADEIVRLRAQIAEALAVAEYHNNTLGKRIAAILSRGSRGAAEPSDQATVKQSPAEPSERREPSCVANWPGCYSGGYDPACCRFPKSCSVRTIDAEQEANRG